jgi:hypothetical protein
MGWTFSIGHLGGYPIEEVFAALAPVGFVGFACALFAFWGRIHARVTTAWRALGARDTTGLGQ